MASGKSVSQSDVISRLPLTPAVFHILLALADGEKHGYGILSEFSNPPAVSVKLGPGTLYGTIYRMVGEGLIEESDSRRSLETDDQRRKYYRLTALGRHVAKAEASRLDELVQMARMKRLILSTESL